MTSGEDIVVAEVLPDAPSAGLTLAEASELTARIGQALEHAELLIAQAYLRRVWEPLGLPSWNAYIDAHFGERPILTVPRQDRQTVVQSLTDAGMSGRAIARAIGVSEGTVRNDLRDEGAQNCAPEPAGAAEVECPTCGELHPAEVGTCPYLAEAFGPITDLQDRDDDTAERLFGRPDAEGPRAGPDDPDAGETDEVDCEDEPLPTDDDPATGPDSDASARVRRLRTAVDRVTALRDDLDELPALVADMERDLTAWPPGPVVTPPADLPDRLRDQLAAVRRALPELPQWLTSAERVAATWDGAVR